MKHVLLVLLGMLLVNFDADAALPPITGTLSLCNTGTTSLSNATSGGTWLSGSTGVATIDLTTGVVTGVTAGTSEITYTSGAESITAVVTVDPSPDAGVVSGFANVCHTGTAALSSTINGGTWASGTPSSATVSTSGLVSGVAAGTTIITYTITNACGIATATHAMTVDILPDVIGTSGSPLVCVAGTTTLTGSPVGGNWNSSNITRATVNSSGIVSGVSAGTAGITYTISNSCGSATSTTVVTVNSVSGAGTITGTPTVCEAATTALANSIPTGTWASSATGIATVSSAGLVSGIAAGTAEITYTVDNGCGSANTTQVVTVNPLVDPGVISGNLVICAADATMLASTQTGGTWSSSNTAIATVTTAGSVTGVSAGTVTISYTRNNSCGNVSALAIVTVSVLSTPITGTFTVCPSATTTLANATTGGTWSSGAASLATVGATNGIVTGVSAGVVVISYTLGGCVVTEVLTVNALADPGGISGPSGVCVGADITFAATVTGGVWSSSNMAAGTISTAGDLSGLAIGTTTISYTATNVCGSVAATTNVTVNDVLDPGVLSGPSTLCSENNITILNTVTGGTWSSSDAAVANVDAAGIVSGIAGGTATITYTATNICGSTIATTDLTVNGTPATISGTLSVCRTFTAMLTNDTAGGTWSTPGTNVTIDGVTGLVTGVNIGTATISYTMPTGCYRAVVFTVNTQPATIGGTYHVCEGANRTLTCLPPGGLWTSSDAAVAGIGVATVGTVTGVAAGTTTITYALSTGCFSVHDFTVNPMPATITGSLTVCISTSSTLANTLPGGTWSSSNPARASVEAISGTVTGVLAGTSNITYTTTGSCFRVTQVTVNPTPTPITGTTTVCAGNTTTLSNTVPLGVWITSATDIAVVVVPTGVIGGVAAGTSLVSYALSNGCFRSVVLTVNPLPAPVTGAAYVCTGLSTPMVTTSTGGTWSSIHSTVTVGTSGSVTGVTAGTAAISYTLPTGCRSTYVVTVNTSPAPITGSGAVCVGSSTVLSSSPATGTWSSSSTDSATIESVAGIVDGVAAGTVVMSYTLPTGCKRTHSMTVNPLPAAITGGPSVCAGGATITLASASAGGTWISGATSVATAGSASGVVTGIMMGTTNITYTLPTGCKGYTVVTVNPLPVAGTVSGASYVCQTASTTLTSDVAGGIWNTTSGAASISGAGLMTGISGGTDVVSYSVTDGCGTAVALFPVTVGPLPDPGTIVGYPHICVGATGTLTDAMPGGTWSNGSTTTATVNASGVVTGIGAGTATISYTRTNSCGSTTATLLVTVHTFVNPGVVVGVDSMCIGDSVLFTNAIPGGTWTSSTPWIAGINDTGNVAALFPGTTIIRYALSNECSTDTAERLVKVLTQIECEAGVHTLPGNSEANVKMYPNPNFGILNFDTKVAGILTVSSLDGRTVASIPVARNISSRPLPTHLVPGVYMCRFTGSDGSTAVVRLVYER